MLSTSLELILAETKFSSLKTDVMIVSSPDHFFPLLFVVAENKNGKKQSGDETNVMMTANS